MNLDVYQMEAYFSGMGGARLLGQVRDQALINAKGVGEIDALNLTTKIVHILSSGVNSVRVTVTDDALIEVTGLASVFYRLPAGKAPSKATSYGLGQVIRLT